MGLRCLLGHDFGEPETERERNEEGNEVVVTVREVKTCERCGEKQVVSENKEITSIDQLRESATGGQSGAEQSTTETSASTGDEWGTDDLSPGESEGTDEPTTAEAPSADPTGTEATAADTTTADAATAEEESATVEPDEDPIERGVADIIEQAEKDDDMLQQPSTESAEEPETPAEDADETGTESDDDVPVHPGQRSAAAEESEDPDPESDDGVILDDEASSPPEEGRRQWEEEASPEEVPGQDLTVSESSESEPEPESPSDDAEILDAGPETTPDSGHGSEQEVDPTVPETDAPEQSSTPSAVESEDAEIMDAGSEPSEPAAEPSEASPEPTTEPEPSEPAADREETDEGHMPWPEAPGEDEGHDASPPDGEPADVDLSGGLAPKDEAEGADQSSTETSAETTPADSAETTPDESIETTPDDHANGHRAESGESSDASVTPNANVDLQQSSRDAQLEYYCPECGLTRDVGNSSMRAGDICPECRVGYITEQQKAE